MKENLKNSKSFVKVINSLINRQGFYDDLLEISNYNLQQFCVYFGQIIQYYIETRDTNISYPLIDILFKSEHLTFDVTLEEKYNNAIKNGFFTHSCAGVNEDIIIKSGLGTNVNYNDEMYKKLLFLEQETNSNIFFSNNDTYNDKLYFCAPGSKSIHYAMNFCPERLYIGLLKQNSDDILPVMVGESKTDYYKRVLFKKIKDKDNYELLKNISEEVIDYYLMKPPIICFFPIFSDRYTISPYMEYFGIRRIDNFENYIAMNIINPSDFFTKESSIFPDLNHLDNLFMKNTIIPPEDIGIIQIPDHYDLIQLIAKKNGLKQGQYIDYYNGSELETSHKKK